MRPRSRLHEQLPLLLRELGERWGRRVIRLARPLRRTRASPVVPSSPVRAPGILAFGRNRKNDRVPPPALPRLGARVRLRIIAIDAGSTPFAGVPWGPSATPPAAPRRTAAALRIIEGVFSIFRPNPPSRFPVSFGVANLPPRRTTSAPIGSLLGSYSGTSIPRCPHTASMTSSHRA